MTDAVGRLLDAIVERNRMSVEDIISIQFTQTADLTGKNAAAALRDAREGFGHVPLFCSAEPEVESAPARMVRVLVTWMGNPPARPVYLDGAAALRPDLLGG